jgi:hypothetical protein
MSRWKAATIHLLISAAIGILVGVFLFGVWYPPPYFHAGGADQLVLLLVGVDLTLGPLLTLVVFRSGKRGLTFDLWLISLVQTAALVYGMSVVLQSRPVFLVAVPDRFVMVSASEISDADLAEGKQDQFRSRSWTGPRLVAAEIPTDPTEKSNLAFSALAGRDLEDQPKYYRDYDSAASKLLANAKPLEALLKTKPQFQPMISSWLAASGKDVQSVVWLPLTARKSDLVMLMDAKTAHVLQALAIDPW